MRVESGGGGGGGGKAWNAASVRGPNDPASGMGRGEGLTHLSTARDVRRCWQRTEAKVLERRTSKRTS